MASKSYALNFKLFFLSLLSLTLFLQILTSLLQLNSHPFPLIFEESSNKLQRRQQQGLIPNVPRDHININESVTSPIFRPNDYSIIFDFFWEEFKERDIQIGLLNLDEGEEEKEEWSPFGNATQVHFDRVPHKLKWEDFFPEWINEERWPLPKCPKIPMPKFQNYGEFDVIVSRVPCGDVAQGEGVRDVFRLQVNVIVANMVVRSRRQGDDQRPIYAVFIGSCGPMWEIFRCDDLLKHNGEIWIYKPDLRRLKQKVVMPIGTCRLALPYVKQGDGKINYMFGKFGKTIDHPREAYVTMLHSSEEYVCGAIALAQSIIKTNSKKDRVLLADGSITKKNRQALRTAGWKIKHINRIRNPHAEKNSYNEWNYSKLRIWQLTEYDKVIFIDSDLIILKNIDNFFMSPQLSAAANNKVLFNSGVMLIEPSKCMFDILMQKTRTLISYNGGDQGFLNEVFTYWHRWPKKVNYLKIFDANDTQHALPESNLYAVHYLGLKPWLCYRDYDCNWDSLEQQPYASDVAHTKWWQIHDSMSKNLQKFCALSKLTDWKIRRQRKLAKKSRLVDEHWKIKVNDSRKSHLV